LIVSAGTVQNGILHEIDSPETNTNICFLKMRPNFGITVELYFIGSILGDII